MKKVYWHIFDEPIVFTRNIKGVDTSFEITREVRCDDDRVDKIWEWGGLALEQNNENNLAVHYVGILFKDGSRHEKEILTANYLQEITDFLNTL